MQFETYKHRDHRWSRERHGYIICRRTSTVVPVQGMQGTTKEIGARYLIASVVVDQEPNALVDLLDLANKGENPRVTKAMLDSYIDSEEVDIDELMEKTKDFLSKTNATKKAVKEILKEYEEQMAKKRQAQEQ